KISVEPAIGELLPQTALPMRPDRETIYLGSGRLPAKFEVSLEVAPRSLMWTVSAASAERNNAFLAPMHRQAVALGGVSVFFAGNDLLIASKLAFEQQLDQMVKYGAVALQQRNLKQAEAVSAAIRDLDPENPDAKAIEAKAAVLKGK